jgi:microsomal prostaglandin-E synthase 2
MVPCQQQNRYYNSQQTRRIETNSSSTRSVDAHSLSHLKQSDFVHKEETEDLTNNKMVLIKSLSDSLGHSKGCLTNRILLASCTTSNSSYSINRCYPTNLLSSSSPSVSVQRYFTATPISSNNNSINNKVGSNNSITPYYLYQYKICPFSNIAKAVMTYQQIPFRSIEVNPLTKAELKFSKDYKKVPIVVRNIVPPDTSNNNSTAPSPLPQQQQQFNGTEEILAHFASPHYHDNSSNNDNNHNTDNNTFASSPSSIRWQDFAKTKLAPLLYPNLCTTLSSSFRAFDYVHCTNTTFTPLQRYSIQYIGSVAMYLAASKIKKKYQLDNVRAALEDAMQELEGGLNQLATLSSSSSEEEDHHSSNNNQNDSPRYSITFLSQEQHQQEEPPSSCQPHLGDLSVYGVLKGLEGLPIFDDLMTDSRFGNIQGWYRTMDELVSSHNT